MVFRRGTDGKSGLPSTPQGVNLMARREGWVSRRRSGVQGKALEYHIDSLPFGANSLSALREADHPDYDIKRRIRFGSGSNITTI